ncbi:hypothetical protein LWI29_017939 [Acer saccharum]|uniref:Uncharacterized protein n=1 Tax=Acer saccharum TaxID=4024 RepID=A0AA39VCC9_ACESA|nr:hypothetical protein LWI29_017939 [Acer saccharum]KAK1561127.1 hypothetical protein Q3G72_034776 [Acer saccharum]
MRVRVFNFIYLSKQIFVGFTGPNTTQLSCLSRLSTPHLRVCILRDWSDSSRNLYVLVWGLAVPLCWHSLKV